MCVPVCVLECECECVCRQALAFLETERSKQLGIALSKFNKIGLKAVIVAVQEMDDEPLGGLDGVDTLVLNVPKPEEVCVPMCV